MSGIYAHSLPGQELERWEPLNDHLIRVGDTAAAFAEKFGAAEIARLAGRLHDLGKCSAEVQAYLRGQGPSRDHSTAGARVAITAYGHPIGRMLATIVAGHHAGLADGVDLNRRFDEAQTVIPAYEGWEKHTGLLPKASALRPTLRPVASREAGFSEAFLTRMLFSCLVDADFLETERFYAEAEGKPVVRGGRSDLAVLRDRLRAFMDDKRAKAGSGLLAKRRAEILDHAIARAALEPGIFTLTVPTGGGKTLAALSFALEHALLHGMRRVITVAPFTAIIEQTATVFRAALGSDADVLEHHAGFDWEAAKRDTDTGWANDPIGRLRRAAENWDAPIIVTTAVQFFESLFAARTSQCRKLHNLARSVIVLDEAQTLPLHLLRPCMVALDELARNYGASIVLCTATQPALREMDGVKGGFRLDDTRELAPDPKRLYAELRRVHIERLDGLVGDDLIAQRFSEQAQMLCIVNSRAHARDLFERIRDLPGAIHLSTLMCPRHRRMVLAEARSRLTVGKPVRIVSTSLIEAGVDIDLPEVWRAATGLDAIAQAAGRCNREGRLTSGRVVVFEPAEAKPPAGLKSFWQAAESILRSHDDPLALEAVQGYFRELYWQKGYEAFDAPILDGHIWRILPNISERTRTLAFPFASIARAFRVIEETMQPIIVPWRADPADDEVSAILARIAIMERPLGCELRRLQGYTVSIPAKIRDAWLAWGVLRPVHPSLDDALLRFDDMSLYDEYTGVRLDQPVYRAAEANIIG